MDAADDAFEVAPHHVDPAGASNFCRSASATGVQRGVRVADLFLAAEAGQPVRIDLEFGYHAMRSPVRGRGIVEATHGLDHPKARPDESGIGLHCNQERLLVLRSAPNLATIALAAEVGTADLYEPG